MSFVAPGEAASLKLMADAYDNDHKLKMMQSKPIALICMVMGTDLAEISSAIAAYARIWIQWSLSKKKKSEERQWSNFRFPFPQEVNGSVLDQSPVYNLSAKHYVKEFGEVLYKRAYLVSVPIDPANYVGLKLAALATERKFSYPVETENQHVRMYRSICPTLIFILILTLLTYLEPYANPEVSPDRRVVEIPKKIQNVGKST
ncbi:hypothetical protein AAMO2058_000849000 [Amorphochlora amoebiformis]